jgi:taurine--2-oxoglutarate transaminase
MTGQQIVDLNRQYTLFSWSAQRAVHPIPMTHAEGVYFWDADGRRYMDFSSQVMNVNVGHGHPKIIAAIKEQADRLLYAAPGFATDVRGELGQALAEIAPGDLHKSFFTLGGAEANENAIKLARLFTGRSKIITRYRSYHGATYGAVSASGDPRRLANEPGIPGIVRVFDPYCYRCVFGQNPETCQRECISHIEQVIQFEGPENVAAILMEGVTGTNGVFVPPDDYWPRLRQLCDQYGILLISDEVMSGFGRTGAWFAVDHWGVVPDMITAAKGITSGALPLGAVLVSRRITEYLEDQVFYGGLTGNSHPMCCAAALATISVYQEEGLLENAQRLEPMVRKALSELQEQHPCVGEFRGLGLFWAIELVKDRTTREPLSPWRAKGSERGVMAAIKEYLHDHGLYTDIRWNWIFVAPPLSITTEQLAEGLAIIDQALALGDSTSKAGSSK